jgi:hypothetical protein
MKVGPGGPSPIAKWTDFFMSHESAYSPSPDFLEARDHVLRMMGDTHGKTTILPIVVEIPVSLQLATARSGSDHFADHMKQLQELIESMKRYSADAEELGRGDPCPLGVACFAITKSQSSTSTQEQALPSVL